MSISTWCDVTFFLLSVGAFPPQWLNCHVPISDQIGHLQDIKYLLQHANLILGRLYTKIQTILHWLLFGPIKIASQLLPWRAPSRVEHTLHSLLIAEACFLGLNYLHCDDAYKGSELNSDEELMRPSVSQVLTKNHTCEKTLPSLKINGLHKSASTHQPSAIPDGM